MRKPRAERQGEGAGHWHAIDHHTGKVLAYVFGRRKDKIFLKLKVLLEPFGLTHYYTDKWGSYTRHLDPEQHTTSKRYTQKIERKMAAATKGQTPRCCRVGNAERLPRGGEVG